MSFFFPVIICLRNNGFSYFKVSSAQNPTETTNLPLLLKLEPEAGPTKVGGECLRDMVSPSKAIRDNYGHIAKEKTIPRTRTTSEE